MRPTRALSCLALVALCACGRDVTSIGAEHVAQLDAGARDASAYDAAIADAGDAGAEGLYLEAEDGELTGFAIEATPEASGGAALRAPDVFADAMPGEARARYAFELPARGTYTLWGRVYAPDVDANRFWVQLDDAAPFLWRISTGETWYWDDVHVDRAYGEPLALSLEAGAHVLVVSNAGPNARLDRLYITAGDDVPPGNDTPCDPPHTVELGGSCVPSCGLLRGTACGPVACEGLPPLPAYDCSICCQLE